MPFFPLNLPSFFAQRFLENSVQEFCIALLAGIGLFLGAKLLLFVTARWVRRLADASRTRVDDIIVASLLRVPGWILLLLSLSVSASLLRLPPTVETMLSVLRTVFVVVLVIVLLQRLLEYLLVRHAPRLRRADDHALPGVLKATIVVVLWSMGVLFLLSNFGINIFSLVAGLGIGGIAIALAVQNILGDMFSSYSLYLDQPFKEGDFIVVGAHAGTVQKVGLKTTRIRALSGEEIVISNQELTTTRIQNYKRMQERRVAFFLRIEYGTPREVLEEIPGMIQEVIEREEQVRFDRAHFFRFGDSSLDFEIVFHVLTPEYTAYMDILQRINFGIMAAFENRNVSFAFPTRTVHVKGEEGE